MKTLEIGKKYDVRYMFQAKNKVTQMLSMRLYG